jgi:hypothetical protein
MSISYEWGITRLETQDTTNLNGELLQKSIIKIWYWKEGTHSDGRKGKYVGLSVLSLKDTSASDFVALADVTQAQVLTWIANNYETGFEATHVDRTIQSQIDETTREDLDDTSFPWV